MQTRESMSHIVDFDNRLGLVRLQVPLFFLFDCFREFSSERFARQQFKNQVLVAREDLIDVDGIIVGIIDVNTVFECRVQRDRCANHWTYVKRIGDPMAVDLAEREHGEVRQRRRRTPVVDLHNTETFRGSS